MRRIKAMSLKEIYDYLGDSITGKTDERIDWDELWISAESLKSYLRERNPLYEMIASELRVPPKVVKKWVKPYRREINGKSRSIRGHYRLVPYE